MKSIDVCLTPELIHLYEVKGKIVVIVDILRATSCMTTALAHGIKEIRPVSKVEECLELSEANGCLGAAERDGKTPEGFSLGNSPFSYMSEELRGRCLAMTTTNGTQAINKSLEADTIIVGSFLNKSSVLRFLKNQDKDVLIVCAGWKGKVNLEDTLFAGALIDALQDEYDCEMDASIMAHAIYLKARKDMYAFISNSSHFKRLSRLNIQKDIEFCLTEDVYDVLPVLKNGKLVKMEVPVIA